MLVGTGANKAQGAAIFLGALPHQATDLLLSQRLGDPVETPDPQPRRDFIKQLVDAGNPDGVEHRLHVVLCMRNKWHG